jgi:ActR/RegA family two-component response regulator/predicted Ser/Thr protein kinase
LPYEARKQAAANAYTGLCLVVHDDLELRLRLAGLVRRAVPALDAHCVGGAGLENLSLDQLRSYCSVLIIVEFMQKNAGSDPLTAVARLRARVPLMPILLFARHGNERFAARAMKAGAVDYWPIHSVDVAELAAALQPYVQPGPGAENAPKSGAAATDAARYPEVAGYRLLKTIAHTAASTVYLARNSDLGQMVALKVQNLQGLASVSDEDRQRFARECEILSSLNHRSIADVIDFGITPEYLYLALEYFPCGSMRERLKNPVSESDALNYARQIAGALQVVHAAGVVHRDLKPSNLMLTTDNRPVLIDFGSARAQLIGHDLSRSDLMTGTPYYVCPEQVDGNDPDQRGDLYSLGIIFYEMLAGRLPFTGSKLTDIFDGHRNGPIPLLPAPLARYQPLINRLLAKKPDDRYASAQHFLEALDAAAASNGASASKTS